MKLDHRHLRTPLKQLFLVPTEGLALAVAEEWQTQIDVMQPSLMHFTSLCNTVLDERESRTREEVAETLVGYVLSDTL